MKKKQWFILIGIMVTALVAGSIAYLIVQHKVLYHFAVVEKGKVYRSGTLSVNGLKWAHARSGFKTIVNLRTNKENLQDWYKKEEDFARKNGIKLVDIPMSRDTPPTPEQIEHFLKIARNPENLPLIIHCHQGVTRTAMMVAVYEIAVQGKKNEDVYKKMEMFNHSFDKPGKKAVKDFILTFRETDKAKAGSE